MGTGYFPGVKSGRGVTLNPNPLLVPWSRKSRSIPLLPLWAVRPIQSLSACARVRFTFTCLGLNLSCSSGQSNVLGNRTLNFDPERANSRSSTINSFTGQRKRRQTLNRPTVQHVMFLEYKERNFLWTEYFDRRCICDPIER